MQSCERAVPSESRRAGEEGSQVAKLTALLLAAATLVLSIAIVLLIVAS